MSRQSTFPPVPGVFVGLAAFAEGAAVATGGTVAVATAGDTVLPGAGTRFAGLSEDPGVIALTTTMSRKATLAATATIPMTTPRPTLPELPGCLFSRGLGTGSRPELLLIHPRLPSGLDTGHRTLAGFT